MKSKLFLTASLILFSLFSTFAQEKKENLLEKVDLTFYIEAEPSIEDAGFNNPKSSWKIEYELYLSDWDTLKKLGRCGLFPDSAKEYCQPTVNQKLDKRIKKTSVLVSKGKVSRKQLAADFNRKIVQSVNFSPQIIETFNQAAKIREKNPVFVFFVKTKVSTKNSAKEKLKKKYMTEGLHWLKIYNPDNSFDYWNVSKLSFGVTVERSEKGSLYLRTGYTQIG